MTAPLRRPIARLARWWDHLVSLEPAALATGVASFVVVAGAVLFTLAHLQPGLLVTSTTPAGGDMGAHVWGPAYLRDVLLPAGRLSGWTPDWYAGFPAYHFYMVVPSLAIVALDVVLPYGVAFKLVTVSGLLALPVCAWALGRLARLPFPGPPLLAVAATVFLFDRSFTIYGGNIASTLAGEFAFSISLAFALLFLGVVLRGLETGRLRAWAAVLLALCALCHIIPAIFAVVAGLIAVAVRGRVAGLRWAVPTGIVGGLLTAFWTVPFVGRRAYLNDMGWEKLTTYVEHLLPGRLGEAISEATGGAASADVNGADLTVWVALAFVGAVVSVVFRRRLGSFLAVLAVVSAVAFVLAPQGRLWNARLLPFWYLCIYLLAALAVAEVASSLATLVARRPERPVRGVLIGLPVAAAVVVFAALALPLRTLPFGSTSADDASYSWAGISTTDRSFLPDWAKWNYSGYERKPAYPEYRALIDTMAGVGADVGCGRAMWEYEPELDRHGTPMALMLLPYWTDGCIGSMEGLYFEASASTPYHFLNQAELSENPSSAQRDLPYVADADIAAGVRHLQLMGVRYYMAFSDKAVSQAATVADLTEVTTSGPHVLADGRSVTWHVYEVAGSELVAPLENEPAVLTDVPKGGEGWLEPSVAWYNAPDRWDVMLAADGPDAWARITSEERPAAQAVAPVTVSSIEVGNDRIAFDVDEPGTPVVVKASYFPNWEVEGAEGPYRVAPNLMVVVPTATSVVLSYGQTPVEWLAWTLTALGVAGTVALARLAPVAMPALRRRREAGLFDGDGAYDDGDVPLDDGVWPGAPLVGGADGWDQVGSISARLVERDDREADRIAAADRLAAEGEDAAGVDDAVAEGDREAEPLHQA